MECGCSMLAGNTFIFNHKVSFTVLSCVCCSFLIQRGWASGWGRPRVDSQTIKLKKFQFQPVGCRIPRTTVENRPQQTGKTPGVWYTQLTNLEGSKDQGVACGMS